jgi:hypothetical protein
VVPCATQSCPWPSESTLLTDEWVSAGIVSNPVEPTRLKPPFVPTTMRPCHSATEVTLLCGSPLEVE